MLKELARLAEKRFIIVDIVIYTLVNK